VAYVTLAPGATTSAEELRVWGAEHVPEPAAAPKTVTVLESIPATHIGKPFKPALRAEATRDAVAEALRHIAGVAAVRGAVEDGAVVAVVELTDGSDDDHVKKTLDRFAINYRMEKS
jgi:fatty-acyl-CoA synthase